MRRSHGRFGLFAPRRAEWLVRSTVVVSGVNSARVARTRTGPRAVDGSTTRPACVISTRPCASSRRAAARTSSMRARHSSPATSRATSDGHRVAPCARCRRRSTMACCRGSLVASCRRPRHAVTHGSSRARVSSVGMRHVSRIPNQRYLLRATIPYNPSRSTRGISHPTRPTCQYQLR